MKKIYETPTVEVSKFSLAADILSFSDQESTLKTQGNEFNSVGFGM